MTINDTLSFAGQVALVTGAAGGLGFAYSRLLAQRGAHVVMQDVGATLDGTGRDPQRIDHAVARLRAEGSLSRPATMTSSPAPRPPHWSAISCSGMAAWT